MHCKLRDDYNNNNDNDNVSDNHHNDNVDDERQTITE